MNSILEEEKKKIDSFFRKCEKDIPNMTERKMAYLILYYSRTSKVLGRLFIPIRLVRLYQNWKFEYVEAWKTRMSLQLIYNKYLTHDFYDAELGEQDG